MSALSRAALLAAALCLSACMDKPTQSSPADEPGAAGGVDTGVIGDGDATGGGTTGGGTTGGISGTTGDSGATDDSTAGSHQLSLDGPDTAVAGEPALFEAALTDADGASVDGAVALRVSPEDGVSVDGMSVIFTAAGPYTVTALADEGALERSRSVEVVAGPADSLALTLSAESVQAGDTVSTAWSAADAWGNPVEGAEVALTVSPEGVSVLGDLLETGAAGEYVVTAQIVDEGASDSQPLAVVAGPAEALVLSLDDEVAEVGDTLGIQVSAADAWGNALEVADVSWSADPADGAVFVDGGVSFEADGAYTISASAGGLSASAGPVTVDSNGPLITLDSPARGEYIEADAVTVSGTVSDAVTGVSSLTLDGAAVSVAADGSFSVSAALDEGINALELAATDGDGNASDAIVGVMSGAYLEDGGLVDALMDLRVEDSAMAGMGDAVSGQVDLSALSAGLLAANPLWDEDYSAMCFGRSTWFTAEFESLDTSALSVQVDAVTGKLRVRTRLEGLSIQVGGGYAYCGGAERALDNTITADAIEVTTTLWLTVDGGVSAAVDSSSVALTGYATDFSDNTELTGLLSLAGVDLDTEIQTLLEQGLADAVEAALPPALEDTFADFELAQTLDMGGASLSLDAWIRDISLDSDGMTLALEGTLDADTLSVDTPENPGSLLYSAAHADLSGSGEDLVFGLSLTTFDRMMHAAWEAGVFEQTVTNDDLGLDGALVGLIFPGASTLELDIGARMAPVMSPGTGGNMYDFALAELTVEVWGEVDGALEHLASMSGWTEGAVALRLGGAGQIVMTTTLDGATLDVIPDQAGDVGEAEALESLLGAFSESLTTGIIPEVDIALPAVAGLSLVPAAVELVGDQWAAVECAVE